MKFFNSALLATSCIMLCSTVAYAEKLSGGDAYQIRDLDREIRNKNGSLKHSKPGNFRTERDVKRWRKSAEKMEKIYAVIKNKSHPDVKQRRAAMDKYKLDLEDTIKTRITELAAQKQKKADDKAATGKLDKRAGAAWSLCHNLQPMKPPYTQATVKAWVDKAVLAKEKCPKEQKFFADYVQKNRKAATYAMKNIARPNDFTRYWNAMLQNTTKYMNAPMHSWNLTVDWIKKVDPKKNYNQLQEKNADRVAKAMEEASAHMVLFEDIDKRVFGRGDGTRKAERKAYADGLKMVREKERIALESTKMCKSKGSKKYVNFLKKELKKKVPTAKIVRAVTSSKKIRKTDTRTYERNNKTFLRKVKWDEVYVCTAEKEGDRYYLYTHKLYYSHVALPGYKTKKWIFSSRNKTFRILKKNIR